jgi:hypothetical protein
MGMATNQAAIAYAESGQAGDAERLFIAAIRLGEESLPYPPFFTTALYNLGVLYAQEGRFGEAEPLLTRSLEVQLSQYGPNHPAVEGARKALSRLQSIRQTMKQGSPVKDQSSGLKVQGAR